MTYNPFHAIRKADDLAPDLAAKLFVPEASPIWGNIQAPINHLIVGPRGAGKTMVLRQLHHQGRSIHDYLSLYLQISRISDIFRSLFSQDPPDTSNILKHYSLVFSDYLCLEILRELTKALEAVGSINKKRAFNQVRPLFPSSANVKALSDFAAWSSDLQQKIEKDTHLWSINDECSWTPLFDLPSTVQRIPGVLQQLLPHLNQNQPCLYLLLDESSPIPEPCQEVLNRLLHRGRHYCVKLAVRPYEWTTLRTGTGARIEIDTDVKPLYIQYPDELSTDNIAHMKAVVERILVEVGDVEHEHQGRKGYTPLVVDAVFPAGNQPYSGFPAICAASSGNFQNLLTLCSCMIATAIEKGAEAVTSVSPATQCEAMVRYSKDYEERNPYEESRSFCQALLRKVRSMPSSEIAIGFQYRHTTDDLVVSDYLPESEGRLIKTAFSAGFIRNIDRQLTPLFDVPARFYLSRGLLPREGLPLDAPVEPPLEIDADYVRKNTGPRRKGRTTMPDRPIKAFLSTSFSEGLAQQRTDLKSALQSVQIDCKDVTGHLTSQFLFTSVVKAIRNTDFTILDATIPRAYTMFEIGICAAIDHKARDVICVVNDEDNESTSVIDALPTFVTKLPIVRYSLAAQRIHQAASEIRSRAVELRSQTSEFSKVSLTEVSLKPRRRDRTVYISLPSRPRRKKTIESLRRKLEGNGWVTIVEEDMKSYAANELQIAVQCAYTARVGIIDTTGVHGGPDLLQCYKLGLFVGKKAPWRALWVEETQYAEKRTFASVPGLKHATWKDEDALAEAVLSFLNEEA